MMRFRRARYSTVLCQKYGDGGGIQQRGTHNTSENGRDAWVALCAHPTHTDTETYPPISFNALMMMIRRRRRLFWNGTH
jgi:hypothetical protein